MDALDSFPAPETRHRALLDSNEPPEDSDVAFVHSVVLQADAHLTCIHEEILKIQDSAKLKQLEAERESLSGYRGRNKAILSPLRRMPPELLGEIFLCSLPSITEIRALSPDEYLSGSPWVLSHVSSRWRAISLSTPSLWS
ncbi:hypothetical protein K438DRAFT_1569325, partial [Mycena galopus ATCC 62051]